MFAKKIKIASLIITHNRVDEARAQMDIIRELWQPMFETVDIYHEFNGKQSWYPKRYKEDFLHRHKQMSHFFGANHLLNQGFKHVLESENKYDFIIATSADAWFYDPKKLKAIILTCSKNRYQLATSLWGIMGLGTEFFIIIPELANKIFPLRFRQILRKYKLLKWTHAKLGIFESLFTLYMIKVLKNPNKIYLIPGRRTVWPPTNRYWSPNFYASHHDPEKRRRDIAPKIYSLLRDKLENMPALNQFLQ